jgi:hypothetical protein
MLRAHSLCMPACIMAVPAHHPLRLPAACALLALPKRLMAAAVHCMQMASVVGEAALVEEGAARAYQLLAPLLALMRPPACLIKPLSQLLLCMKSISPAPAAVGGQAEQQHRAAMRVAAAASYHLLKLAAREGELQLAQAAARPELPLLQAAISAAGLGDGGSQAVPEVAALQDAALLLLGPEAAAPAPISALGGSGRPAAASGPGAVKDLAARVLPLLASADPIAACWPLLSAPALQIHPRWLELCVRAAEAAVRKRAASGLQQVVDAVKERARQGTQLPRIEWGAQRWTMGAAAVQAQAQALPEERAQQALAELQAQQLQVGPAGQLAARCAWPRGQVQATGATETWPLAAGCWLLAAGRAPRSLLFSCQQPSHPPCCPQEQQRLAATVLLQQRLPALRARRALAQEARARRTAWLPWLARLHNVLGMHAALEARNQQPVQAAEALQVLQHFGRAAQLGLRAGPRGWHELRAAAQHMWNCGRPLLAELPGLCDPTAAAAWEQAHVQLPARATDAAAPGKVGAAKARRMRPARPALACRRTAVCWSAPPGRSPGSTACAATPVADGVEAAAPPRRSAGGAQAGRQAGGQQSWQDSTGSRSRSSAGASQPDDLACCGCIPKCRQGHEVGRPIHTLLAGLQTGADCSGGASLAALTAAAAALCRAAAEALVALVQGLAGGAQLHCSVLPHEGHSGAAGASSATGSSSSKAPLGKAGSMAGSKQGTPRPRAIRTSLLPTDLEVSGEASFLLFNLELLQ